MTRHREDISGHAPGLRRRLRSVRLATRSAARLLVGHKGEVQGDEVIPCRQRGNLALLSLPYELTMRAHQVADRRVREHVLVIALPAEQTGDRDKREFLREQTGPFLEATSYDDATVWRQDCIAGDHMGLRVGMRTDLARQREGAKAARDGDRLMAVSVDHLRGKKTDGGAPSDQHQ